MLTEEQIREFDEFNELINRSIGSVAACVDTPGELYAVLIGMVALAAANTRRDPMSVASDVVRVMGLIQQFECERTPPEPDRAN